MNVNSYPIELALLEEKIYLYILKTKKPTLPAPPNNPLNVVNYLLLLCLFNCCVTISCVHSPTLSKTY